MTYSFDVEHATKYGVDEAIMLHNILHWVAVNRANGNNQHDGRTWTYNSVRAFSELFPFWSSRQVERILSSLEKQGVIVTGCYNKHGRDRTKWYALTDEEAFLPISPNGEMHSTKRGDAFHQTVEALPDIKPDTKLQIDNTGGETRAREAEQVSETGRPHPAFDAVPADEWEENARTVLTLYEQYEGFAHKAFVHVFGHRSLTSTEAAAYVSDYGWPRVAYALAVTKRRKTNPHARSLAYFEGILNTYGQTKTSSHAVTYANDTRRKQESKPLTFEERLARNLGKYAPGAGTA